MGKLLNELSIPEGQVVNYSILLVKTIAKSEI